MKKLTFDRIMAGKSASRITRRGPIPCKCPNCGGVLISKKVKDVLEANNLWWQSKGFTPVVPEFERERIRALVGVDKKKAIILIGPRQSGKTTIMQQTIKNLLKHTDPLCIVYAPMDMLKGATLIKIGT